MSQTQTILKHLKKYRTITTWQAFDLWQITRLSGRILELRQAGYKIRTTMEHYNGKHYGVYKLGK